LNKLGECVKECEPNEYVEKCSDSTVKGTNIEKCYPCHKSCAGCSNGLADSCTSCATDY